MSNTMNQITSCEVCGNLNLIPVLDLGKHPMCDDLVEVGNDRVCREYPIEILFCKECLTAHQKYQVPKHDLFPTTYHYRSRFTADVLNGMKGLVASCEERFGKLEGKKVLDIGCNDGSLLDFFREKGAVTIGIEPTGACSDAASKNHIAYNDFLSPDVATKIIATHGKPDFITFTNVFAHIENLHEVLDSLQILMAETTVIVIENHYLGAVLTGNQFDTFYHEHPRTYSYNSFVHMARSLGLEPIQVEFPARYGGNIRVCLGKSEIYGVKNGADIEEVKQRENKFFEGLIAMNANIEKWQKNKLAELTGLVKQHGPLKAKAFPGRAAILVKLLNLDTDMVSEVYEKPGSLKIGYYLPGTRIPIKSDEDMYALEDKTKPIINLAWHISKEIHNYLTQQGYTGSVIDILSSEDFA
ncbi:MAG: hypothetical protein JWM28_196 [Chitinophagaceae bacterium]|nr:hypothetical protein [Chitinophagaceae bacterium]